MRGRIYGISLLLLLTPSSAHLPEQEVDLGALHSVRFRAQLASNVPPPLVIAAQQIVAEALVAGLVVAVHVAAVDGGDDALRGEDEDGGGGGELTDSLDRGVGRCAAT